VAALVVAFTSAALLAKLFGAPVRLGRFPTIDGLRGYLPFCVFLHHAVTWYFYLKTDRWGLPPSKLYIHLGQTGVAFFFMITGFLFLTKLIEGKEEGIDWLRLYVSRFFRLVPLYLVLMLLVFLVVAGLSQGERREPLDQLMQAIFSWLGFTIAGTPDINGVENTFIIVAGVTWSLVYEWFFYFSLPVFALVLRVHIPLFWMLLGGAAMTGIVLQQTKPPFSFYFLGGIAAAMLVRSDVFCRWAASWIASLIAIGCIACTVAFFPSAYGKPQLLLLSTAFIIIAAGNSLFGALTHGAARFLGEMAYGIYLLHGIVLFLLFHFSIGIPAARTLTALTHWMIVVAATPMVIIVSFLAFKFIEHPAQKYTGRVVAWLRALGQGRRGR
jgi:peptidoglycan/LPS O-acetylase OafA/YrhL